MTLIVLYDEIPVGTIVPDNDNTMRFTYSDNWKNSDAGFPISLSLPLSGEYTRGQEALLAQRRSPEQSHS